MLFGFGPTVWFLMSSDMMNHSSRDFQPAGNTSVVATPSINSSQRSFKSKSMTDFLYLS